MRWLLIADQVARTAILISIYGAVLMGLALAYLVARRARKEREAEQRRAQAGLVLRDIMRALATGTKGGDAFEHAPESERIAAINHIGELVRGEDHERLIAFVERNDLFDGIRQRARRGTSAKRTEAVRLLGTLGGGEATAILHAALRHDHDPAVRLEAAAMLARLSALPTPEVLFRALNLEETPITPLHYALFRSLAPHRGEELRALAHRILPPPLRAVVIDALGWTEDYSGLPALGIAAGDPHPDVRIAALHAMARLDHPAAAKWILPMLKDQDEAVRSEAIWACSTMGLRAAAPQIAELRSDPSALVRVRAAAAIERLEPAR